MIRKLVVGLMALMMSLTVWAAEPFQDGVHYETLPFAVKTADPDKVEVTEMFGYLCPHCNSFEPLVAGWHKRQNADEVQFVRVPVVFGRSWEPFARAYYTAELMGAVDQSHQQMFDAIHLNKQRFSKPEDMVEFYGKLGVDREKFGKLMNSFAVNTKLNQGESKARSYEITGVPTMVVNGKYRVTASSAGGHKQMLEVVDYLVEKERQSR
ncbi:thiol:disulfide interchange protein DsbA/DsbL [Marinobacterium rhizophilum]|uniref:Thiol:disulfide interchange protein n=1 Tax=Marinobacterium rhizophilum TaxID=420402 RepID=A0ABY5HET1_9GAMM|nr:thiol:disulfide interchange protein DsbA/DsbL [Marinobacterium rhizophilum]UTW10861.1 thiol:disulfide interchange protein DsbA/DsbL [Marinobacterium rhizophilum]